MMKMKIKLVHVVLFLLSVQSVCRASIWDPLNDILESAVYQGVFPGCVALVGNQRGILYANAVGNFTYSAVPPYNTQNPPMNLQTRFDMASCTKVTITTTAIAQFYQRGQLKLDDPITDFLGEEYAQNGKKSITVRNCLLHNTGYPPDPSPLYYSPEFGCPSTSYYEPPEVFTCQDKIFSSVLNQTLINPVGSIYVYSDLSMITLMYVVGFLAKELNYVKTVDLHPGCDQGGPGNLQCYYEAYGRLYVVNPLGLKSTSFLPPQAVWNQCAPTENDTDYLHRVIQGQVSDGNSYAAGGICGHAGLFSNSLDLYLFMQNVMYATENSDWMNRTTMELFTKEYNHSQSSRALGWNTNDPTVYDQGWNQSCGSLSPLTWMHLGYTGTMLCGDPERQLIVILLTNRVYPTSANTKIQRLRQVFSTAVQQIYDSQFDEIQSNKIRTYFDLSEFEMR